MKIKDKTVGQLVNVCDKRCPERKCYWPRPDPGVFTQGVGYRQRTVKVGWLCGTREVHGCPDEVTQ
jgi:hypothetical protein